LFVSVELAKIELIVYPLMETVIVLGIPIVKGPGTTLTFAAVKPGRTGVVPAVVLPYRTMF